MKISIIDHVGGKAGMDYYTSSLARGLANNGQQVLMYSNFSISKSKNIVNHKYFSIKKYNKIFEIINFITSVTKSVISSKKNNANHIIINIFTVDILTFFLAIMSKIFSKNLVVIVHDISSFKGENSKFFESILYNTLANFIVVHNNFCKKIIYNKVRINDKIFVIKQGGYINFFDNKKNENLIKSNDEKSLLFFGQIKKDKGLDILLKSMKNIDSKVSLVIAGKSSDIDFSYYKKLIKNLEINNKIIIKNHFISDADMLDLFLSSTIIVLPYKKIYQSAVLLMSMSLGLPVIVSDLEPFNEIIIDDYNGFVFKNGDLVNLAQIINKNIFNQNKLDEISLNAKKTIQNNYNWDEIGKDYIKMLKK